MLLMLLLMTGALITKAQNWDDISAPGSEYYWGVGLGATDEEAMQNALTQMTSMIVTHVKSDFSYLVDETHRQGSLEFEERVQNCVRTYSQATLTDVEFFDPEGKAPNIVRRCYMAKSKMEQVFADRTAKALSMVMQANEAVKMRKVDMALQYYYWAYSLLRSLQRPVTVTDDEGRVLVDRLPLLIDDVLSGIDFKVESVDGDRVNLLVTYRGERVQGLEFTYNDGRELCYGTAKDGQSFIQMVGPQEAYHLHVDYECKELAQGDSEIESVLSVMPRRSFTRANFTLPATAAKPSTPVMPASATTTTSSIPATPTAPSITLAASPTQLISDSSRYAAVVNRLVQAIGKSRYSDVTDCFTLDGLKMWNQLMGYGKARMSGTPQLRYYKGATGGTVVRGMQMSFSFNRGRRRTFVEDVALTFNQEGKIDNVAFGLGQETTNYLMNHKGSGWTDDVKEILTEFLESYKSAYCLARIDYLKQVFADDATIIVGHVAKQRKEQAPANDQMRRISVAGQDKISYNRYTKDEYLKHLEQIFHRNEFINLRFSKCEATWLQKFHGKAYGERELFGIQIGQDYTSTLYSDMGYLFLLVDLTHPEEPTIHIRTWQPNEVDFDKIFSAGDFYN